MNNNIQKFIDNYNPSDFTCTINGKGYKGYFTKNKVSNEQVPCGYHKYEVRKCDTCEKLATIEERVDKRFGGTIILTEVLDLTENKCVPFESYTIDGIPYQDFPQIFKEYGEATEEERKAIIEAVGGDGRKFYLKFNDKANEYHAFKLNLSYEGAEDLVWRLNKAYDDNDIDTPWYLGDCHEIYVEVD